VGSPATTLRCVRIEIGEDSVEVRLALWQRMLGLLGNIRVARSQVSDVEVVEDPIAVAMSAGVKVGLRLPWLYFVARTIGLDEAFVVRRGVPAVSFSVGGGGRLRRVLVSTRDAERLAAELEGS
jgi:hypothetical protein